MVNPLKRKRNMFIRKRNCVKTTPTAGPKCRQPTQKAALEAKKVPESGNIGIKEDVEIQTEMLSFLFVHVSCEQSPKYVWHADGYDKLSQFSLGCIDWYGMAWLKLIF